MTTTMMVQSLLVFLMLLLVILLFVWACKPWRYFLSRSRRSVTVGDLERALLSEDLDHAETQNDEPAPDFDLEVSHVQNDENISSPREDGADCKQIFPLADAHATQGASLVVDVDLDLSEEILVGQTLKRPLAPNPLFEENKSSRKEECNLESTAQASEDYQETVSKDTANQSQASEDYQETVFKDTANHSQASEDYQETVSKDTANQRSSLTLEVISGPCSGIRRSLQSTDTSKLPLTLGRVSPCDLLLTDGEISGKHAMIDWNVIKLKWELTDMGSLNGTLLNSVPVHNLDTESRQWSEPVELSNGDLITLGTTSKINVYITNAENRVPFGVGMTSDPMAYRRGGKKLPMEDVYYYQWPLPGAEQFGLFGICDGHGGRGAAKAASKMLPEAIASTLSVSENRERVLSHSDASSVLRDAFIHTESALHHQYEGCTATVLLVWVDSHEEFKAQCANVGDSACIMNVRGKPISMTEDHRITSHSERIRLNKTGEPLKDGETRLCGINLARMLGDKFLKEQDRRFSAEPYISEVVHIDKDSKAFALLASDGLWDVISSKKAMQLAMETRDRYAADKGNMAEKIANFFLSEARTLRTKDNTSIIFLDFDTNSRTNVL